MHGHLHDVVYDHEAALAHYRATAACTTSAPERNYPIARAARLSRSAK
jgi:hypothetical protein